MHVCHLGLRIQVWEESACNMETNGFSPSVERKTVSGGGVGKALTWTIGFHGVGGKGGDSVWQRGRVVRCHGNQVSVFPGETVSSVQWH